MEWLEKVVDLAERQITVDIRQRSVGQPHHNF